jgi:tRNA nucleotidyltransferase/poly(A) polymerase
MFYEKVFRALNKAGVRYLVAGGIAVNLHGIPRMTQDLDIIVELTPANVRKLVKVLTLLGYRCKLPVNPELISDPAIRHQWINEKNMKVFNF